MFLCNKTNNKMLRSTIPTTFNNPPTHCHTDLVPTQLDRRELVFDCREGPRSYN